MVLRGYIQTQIVSAPWGRLSSSSSTSLWSCSVFDKDGLRNKTLVCASSCDRGWTCAFLPHWGVWVFQRGNFTLHREISNSLAHVTDSAGLTSSVSSAWSNCMANIRHSTGTNLLSHKLLLFKLPLRSKYKSSLFTTWNQISSGTLLNFCTDMQGKVLKSDLQRFWELWYTRGFLGFFCIQGKVLHFSQVYLFPWNVNKFKTKHEV